MEALVYIANCLYLVSYLVKDMLRLRLLTLIAALCLMTYFYVQPEPLWSVVCWNLVFIALNIVQLVRLMIARKIVRQSSAAIIVERSRQASNEVTNGSGSSDPFSPPRRFA